MLSPAFRRSTSELRDEAFCWAQCAWDASCWLCVELWQTCIINFALSAEALCVECQACEPFTLQERLLHWHIIHPHLCIGPLFNHTIRNGPLLSRRMVELLETNTNSTENDRQVAESLSAMLNAPKKKSLVRLDVKCHYLLQLPC